MEKRTPTKEFGYVYVLSNPAMPGIVKIGRTMRDPHTRLRELNSASGVPVSFKIEGIVRTPKPVLTEKNIHDRLHGLRVNRKREFFRIPVKDAVLICKVAAEETGGRFKRAGRGQEKKSRHSTSFRNFLSSALTGAAGGLWLQSFDQTLSWSWCVLCVFCILTGRPKELSDFLSIPGKIGLAGLAAVALAVLVPALQPIPSAITQISGLLQHLGFQ